MACQSRHVTCSCAEEAYPFNSHEWPRKNFSLRYQYNIKQTSNENNEKILTGGFISWCNTKFSKLISQELYGIQWRELLLRSQRFQGQVINYRLEEGVRGFFGRKGEHMIFRGHGGGIRGDHKKLSFSCHIHLLTPTIFPSLAASFHPFRPS